MGGLWIDAGRAQALRTVAGRRAVARRTPAPTDRDAPATAAADGTDHPAATPGRARSFARGRAARATPAAAATRSSRSPPRGSAASPSCGSSPRPSASASSVAAIVVGVPCRRGIERHGRLLEVALGCLAPAGPAAFSLGVMSSLNRNRSRSTDLGQGLHPLLHQRHRRRGAPPDRPRRPPPPGSGRSARRGRRRPSDWMYRLFSQVSFSVSKAAGFDDTRDRSNASISSVTRQHLAIVAGRPAEEREVVHERLGEEPLLAERLDAGRAVALRQRPPVGTDHLRQVCVRGRGPAERLDHRRCSAAPPPAGRRPGRRA